MTSITLTEKETSLARKAVASMYNNKVNRIVQDASINGDKKKTIIRRANEYKELLEKLK